MKLKILVLFFCLLFSLGIYSQRIILNLPSKANSEFIFILNKGIDVDTVIKGRLPVAGDLVLNIPEKYKDYIGIASLQIEGHSSINMIVNHEDFTIEEDSVSKSYLFKNSVENNSLYSFIRGQSNFPADSDLYALRFINLLRYMQSVNKLATQGGTLREVGESRLYAINNLDMESLYTSGFWHNVIDALTRILGTEESFAQDMTKILGRIKSQEVYQHLTENLITITEQYGWDDAFDIIVPYVENSGRIPTPQGQIYTAFVLSKVRKGMAAPEISGLSKTESGTNTLLVFYQPDCDNCHAQINELIKKYEEIKRKGIRIVSISGGSDKETFKEECKKYPWPDKLCDFKGYAGDNFRNYGILATPTFFLLDDKGLVISRFALMSELEL